MSIFAIGTGVSPPFSSYTKPAAARPITNAYEISSSRVPITQAALKP